MSDYIELVDAFIGATEISLDAGLPRTAKRILETHWLAATANEEQRAKLAELRARMENGLRIEARYGKGALINLDHQFAKKRHKHGRVTRDHLIAMRRFRDAQSIRQDVTAPNDHSRT